MNTAAIPAELDRLVSAAGARLVLAASASDGLVVHSAGETTHDLDAVAALLASIYRRSQSVVSAHARGKLRMLTVRAGGEQLLAAGVGTLVLVAVAAQGANVGRIRLELIRAGESLS